jgi:hypothetical protein
MTFPSFLTPKDVPLIEDMPASRGVGGLSESIGVGFGRGGIPPGGGGLPAGSGIPPGGGGPPDGNGPYVGWGGPPDDDLPGFSVPQQDESQWCWAAVALGIASFGWTGPAPSQCEIVTLTLRRLGKIAASQNCCGVNRAPYNKPQALDEPLRIVGVLDWRYDCALKPEEIAPLINRKTPIAIRIRLPPPQGQPISAARDSGHFVAVSGYQTDPADGRVRFKVHDPDGGGLPVRLLYDEIKSYAGPGSDWSHSYTTSYAGRAAALSAIRV